MGISTKVTITRRGATYTAGKMAPISRSALPVRYLLNRCIKKNTQRTELGKYLVDKAESPNGLSK